MEREIKFRAWNVVTKTMIDLRKITPLALNMDTDGLFIPFSDGLPLMQFTGLKDKNGKEIYESDIVQSASGKDIYEVVWKHSGWFRKPLKGNWRTTSLFVEYKNQSVIGNIYEYPELLTPSIDNTQK